MCVYIYFKRAFGEATPNWLFVFFEFLQNRKKIAHFQKKKLRNSIYIQFDGNFLWVHREDIFDVHQYTLNDPY